MTVGYTKDLWTRPEVQGDGAVKRVKKLDRWGKGKRWLACWQDPDGRERSKAFTTQTAADKHWRAMETDRERGEYFDPKAGKVSFGDLGKRWLASRVVDPATHARYESAYRHHVEPTFGKKAVKSIRPSQVQEWISGLSRRSPGNVTVAHHVLQGILDLAVADEALKKSPAKNKIVQVPKKPGKEVQAWADEVLYAVIDGHADMFRAIPIIGAACGLRRGELFGLALEDIDFEEQVIRVVRQIKRLGRDHVFSLPKSDRERTVPLPDWAAQTIKTHVDKYKPEPCTLPWETADGKPHTCNLLFRWTDDRHIRANLYEKLVWKPALVFAEVIPEPTRDKYGCKRYASGDGVGMHALRHYYASVMLAAGVSIKELAEYLGHADPGFTLRVYVHMLPSSHERARKAIDDRMFRPRAVAGGAGA